MLDILKKLDNGYHSLFMIMQSVDLYDTISVEKNSENRIVIKCNTEGVPCNEKNIVYKCADAFFNALSIDDMGITITIEKNIPMAAGTAGGSAEFEFTIYEFEEGNLTNHYVCYVEDENTEWDTELDDIELYWQNNGIKPIDNPEKGRTADTVLYSLDENHMTQIFQLKFNGESNGSSYSEYTFHSKLMSNLDGLK